MVFFNDDNVFFIFKILVFRKIIYLKFQNKVFFFCFSKNNLMLVMCFMNVVFFLGDMFMLNKFIVNFCVYVLFDILFNLYKYVCFVFKQNGFFLVLKFDLFLFDVLICNEV